MDKTIQMARKSWIDVYGLGHDRAKFIEALKHFEALIRVDEREETNRKANASWTLMCEKMVAAEREACAKVCDVLAADYGKAGLPMTFQALRATATEIRARGEIK